MRNFSVKRRLLVVMICVAALLLAIGASGIVGVRNGSNALQRMFEGRALSLQYASEIDELATQTTFSISDAILDPSEKKTQQVTKAASDAISKINQLLQSFPPHEAKAPEASTLKSLTDHWSSLRDKGFLPAIKQLNANNLADAQWTETQTIEPASKLVKQDGQALRALELKLAQVEYTQSKDHARTIFIIVVSLIVFGMGVLGAVFASLTRGLLSQLGAEPSVAASVANRIANGDLAVQISVDARDGESIMFAMEKMRCQLAEMISHIRNSATAIGASTTEIAAGNAKLSHRTEEQAGELQETSASMAQLATTVTANAKRAAQAQKQTSVAVQLAQEGDDASKDAIARMRALAERSSRVREVTGLIEGIAFQTNILALNAAVEAARAGEQGRGFAVVAQEVRALANRSTAATKEIEALITGINHEIEGSNIAVMKSGQSIIDLIDAINDVSSLMNSIATASNEQSIGIEQVNKAVAEIDGMTQQNAAFVQNGARTADTLRVQSHELRKSIEVFQLA